MVIQSLLTGRGSVPDITAAANLAFTSGELRTGRMVPARLRFVGGDVVSSKESTLTTEAQIPDLDRLTRFDRLMNGEEVDPRFQAIWQRSMEAIEAAFEAVNARVDEVAILARISSVEQLAEAANDNASKAQVAAEQTSAAVKQTFAEIDPVYGDFFDGAVAP